MDNYTCPVCGASMTVRHVADGKVIDCDNNNQECAFQLDYEEDNNEI